MVRVAALLLASIARDDRAVEVHSHRTQVDLRKEPPLQSREYGSVACLRELAEEPAIGALARQAVVTEDGGERLILRQPIAVKIAAGSRPDPEPKALISAMPPKGVTGMSEYSIGMFTITVIVPHSLIPCSDWRSTCLHIFYCMIRVYRSASLCKSARFFPPLAINISTITRAGVRFRVSPKEYSATSKGVSVPKT